MSPSYLPAAAAEFPNDNPDLHAGARWVCLKTRGVARALLRPWAQASTAESPAHRADPEPRQPAGGAPPPRAPGRDLSRYRGPLELDLDRIVLMHRVEDIPPPPDFIFVPFQPSPPPEPERAAVSTSPTRIEPVACRVVDAREAARRVARGWRVDIAPCLSIEAADVPAVALPALDVTAAPAPSVAAVAAAESGRRLPRRRGRVAARSVSPLPDSNEVSRAISELEAAFRPAALCSASDESAGVTGCRVGGV